jgi:hypothetical protein
MSIVLPVTGSANWDVPLNTALSKLAQSTVMPDDMGFKTWNFPPQHAIAYTSTQPTAGSVVMMRLPRITQAETITGVTLYRAVIASGLTGAYVALYNSSGTQLAVSANVSGTFGALGMQSTNFTAPYNASAGVDLFAAMLFVGTTPPGIAAAQIVNNQSNLNGLNGVSTAHWAIGATGQTTMPASVTMGSRTTTLIGHWVGLH